jgi:hypothetical protein
MVTVLNDKAIAVEAPEYAHNFIVDQGSIYWRPWDLDQPIKLPAGNWEIIAKASELNEEQWKEIVEWFSILGDTGYQDYGKEYLSYGFKTATESGQSLLKSKNVPIDRVIILIKQ